MIAKEQLAKIIERFEFVEAKMSTQLDGDELVALGKEYAELKPVVETVQAYQQA